jgi:hypothetical protein
MSKRDSYWSQQTKHSIHMQSFDNEQQVDRYFTSSSSVWTQRMISLLSVKNECTIWGPLLSDLI